MSISSVSSVSNSYSGNDNKISALLKQKTELIKELENINKSDEVTKIKKKKIELIQMELQMIDMQIQQIRIEKEQKVELELEKEALKQLTNQIIDIKA